MKAIRNWLIGFAVASSLAVLAAQQPVTVANTPSVAFSQYTPNGDGGLPVHLINGSPTAADNSSNSINKVPVLPCTAATSDPLWTTGNQEPCSVTLAGYERVSMTPAGGTPVFQAALSTTVQTVVSGAHVLTAVSCANANQTATNFAYVQIFDVSGTVTLGTTVPNQSYFVPANSPGGGTGLNVAFANAIKVAATTTASGSAAPATSLDCSFVYR